MDTATARELIGRHGSIRKAAAATGISRPTFDRALRKQVDAPAATEKAPEVKTISLRGVAVLSRRPTDTLKARLFGLRKGVGYRVEDLAAEWHIGPETLRKRCKEHRALGYVEASPGEYVAVVVHPETVKA
jgi:hypothetical protein